MNVSKSVYMMVGLLAAVAFVLGGCADPTEDAYNADRGNEEDAEDSGQDSEDSGEDSEGPEEDGEDEEESEEPEEDGEDEEARIHYELTSDSMIGFVGSSPITGSQRGSFEEFEGTISIVDEDLSTLRAEGVIDATSVTAGSDTLVEALRQDILATEEYPEIRFTATDVEEEDDQHILVGDLELHGVTREIGFPIENPSIDEDSVSMESYFSINRENWDIYFEGHGWDPPGWEGALDDAIRPNVAIQLDLEAERVED